MIKSVSRDQLRRVRRRLNMLYGGDSEKLLERFFMMIGRYGVSGAESSDDEPELWDERDSVLITYADSIHSSAVGTPLNALDQFARKHLTGLSLIHI